MVSFPADVVVVPLASETDAERTCAALAPYCSDGGRVHVVHVVEKAGGAPDKASVEQREERAEQVFDAARRALADVDATVETEVRYGTDVPETIFGAADDVGADLVAFSPRGGSRLARLLSGDTALDLVTEPPVPVLVLPVADVAE